MILNICQTLFLFDNSLSFIIITDIHTCEIKNVLKLNLKNGKQIKKFEAEIPYILKNAQPGLEKRGSYKKKR